MSDKRLSAAEVVESLRADEALYAKCNEGRYSYGDGINLGRSEAFAEAADLVEASLIETPEQSRERFERWYAEQVETRDGIFARTLMSDEYNDGEVNVAWCAWCAAIEFRLPISGPPGDAKGGS